MDNSLSAAAHAMGRRDFATAAALAEAYLTHHPDSFDGQHLLGIALCQCGRSDDGRAHLARAMAQRPDNPDPHYNLGNILLEQALFAEAEASLRSAVELAPRHFSAWNSLGVIQLQTSRPSEAAESYKTVIGIEPRHAAAQRGLGAASAALGNLPQAESAYLASLRLEPAHPDAIQGLGALLFDQGKIVQAHELARSGVAHNPDDPNLRNALGVLELQMANYAQAELEFRHGLSLRPDSLALQDNLGVALSNLGKPEAARKSHEQVLAVDPAHTRALANLAELLEMNNDLDAAESCVEQGLAQYPNHPVLNLVAAKCKRRRGLNEEALAQLAPLSAGPDDAPFMRAVHFELGRIYDGLGQFNQAFSQFETANQLALSQWRKTGGGADPLLPAVSHLLSKFRPGQFRPWHSAGKAPQRIAFLIGFQRSGTTLLDTILDSHSGVQVIEESPALLNVASELARSSPYPDCLAGLTRGQIDELRQQYLAWIQRDQSIRPGQIMVDKSPLNSVHLGLIHRLFPGSPIIFMVRHPLDVCLSCFMQDFTLSPFIANFCTLQSTVDAYDRVMQLEAVYERALSLKLLTVRYEDLVDSFRDQVTAVLDFLGLDWEDDLTRFDVHARRRGLIRTPSYHQVSQPIYRSAVNRWQHYSGFLMPFEDRLAPHMRRFDYEV